MSKYSMKELWEERYGSREEVFDYAGRRMFKSAINDPSSAYHPTQDHKRPIAAGGLDIKGNIEICHRDTNQEKGVSFPHWWTNGRLFRAERVKGKKGEYRIVELEDGR